MGGGELSKEQPESQVGQSQEKHQSPFPGMVLPVPPVLSKLQLPPKQGNASNPNQEASPVEAAF